MAILTKANKPPPHRIDRGGQMEYVMSNGVIINTMYVIRTQEERDRIDEEIARICWDIVDEMIERGEQV